MANYAYKSSNGVVPDSFLLKWCEEMGIDEDELMDGDPIDWYQWDLLTDYIEYLESELAELKDKPE